MLALEAAVKMGAGGFHLGTKVCLALPGLRWLLWLWLLAAPTGDAFYLPGLVPIMYCEEGDPNPHCQSSIQIYADKLYSVESMAAYDYNSFDFCQDALKKTSHDTLWKILSGEQIIPCPYKFSFNKNETCRKVCVKSYTSEDEDQRKLAFLKGGIKQNYYHSWVIDNARVIWCYNSEDEEHYCILGFPIGCVNAPRDHFKGLCLNNLEFSKNNSLYLFNHVDITITYHMTSDTNGDVAKLISTRVDPKSYKHTDENHLTCNEPPLEIPEDADNLNVIYTYSVKFEESKAKWSSEWDYDVRTTAESNILWIRLINSFFVVLALCGLVIIVILKSICRDISKCNRIRLSEYERRQFGWLMIYKSVFRLPEHRMLLSVFLGQGTQIFIMTFFSLILVGLGFLTPVDPTDLVNYAVVLWFLLGIPAGYVAAKLYKTFKGGKWKMHFLLMTLLFPGIFFTVILIMNLILWMEGSSAAVSFNILASLFAFSFGVSTPLTYLGIYFGKKQKFEFPVHARQTPRVSPQRSFFAKSTITVIFGSLVPFGCIFLQLSYILNHIWSPHMYYIFAFLFLVFLILVISCSEVTVLLCYFRLSAENCDWWWRAFLTSSFTSIYVLIFAIHYFFTKLNVTGIGNIFMYFGYSFILVLVFFLFTGTIGFFSCFYFINTIYNVLKVD
ncbi:transmembrane 9 superfamily member 2-like [Mesocricetus auratus]|uniref:Transmembrane 9 superfamily member n=1 Tax=Mesocricetus auratus TaxID=10036 RepID=A0ABM2XAJ6_MESAU|nr:transmembrane 9 superfamily member 2-like [Mesocricetus auratus]